jgi:hypothetical protein
VYQVIRFKDKGATMNLQFAVKLILAGSVAACCVATAEAQTIDGQFTATISSLQGSGWGSGNIGQPVTLDFAYDSSQQTSWLNNGIYSLSAPITSASIVGGPFGNGINLEPNGPSSGTVAEDLNIITYAQTTTIVTSANSPSGGFTGDVFGMSYSTNGVATSLDVVRDAFVKGQPDQPDSGEVILSNVNLVQGVVQAPEIDPASALGALSLLVGGLAVIRGKKFAKAPAP